MRISLILTGLLLAARLAAQDAEIVVTAAKEPTPADTLPVPVVVLGQDDLAGRRSVSDALSDTLAVRLQSQTPGAPALTAPGFGENGFGRVSLLLDGMPQDNVDMSAPPLDLVPVFALDRIEIVRAPMSALYGSGAGGGAVNLITKTPDRFEAQVSAGVESTGSNTQSAAFGVPVGTGGLLLSLQRVQGLPSRDRSDSDSYQGWVKFSQPLSNQKFEAWLGFTRDDAQLPGGLTKAQYDDDPDQAVNSDDSTLRNETSGGASWSLTGGGWRLTVPVSGLVRTVRFITNSSGSFSDADLYRASWQPSVAAAGSLWGADADWSAGIGVAADYLSVKRYADDDFSTRTMWALIDRWTESVWSRGQLNWGDRWYLSADLRVETSHTQADSDEDVVQGHKDFLPVAGDVGLTWLPAAGWKTAVQLSRVYRYPFTDEMISYYGYGSDYFLKDIDAEVGHGATLSASWTDGTWAVSASGTALRMENEVLFDSSLTPSYAPYGRNANLGPTWHASSLVSASWKKELPAAALVLGADYDGEAAVFADGADEGKFVPLIPAHRLKFWTELENKKWGSVKAGWTLSSSFSDGGDNANAEPRIPGRQSLDVDTLVFLGSPEWALRVYGHNLTDDRTPDDVYYGSWYPIEGRVFGVSLAWTL